MKLSMESIGADRLGEYAVVPSFCHVRSKLEVEEIEGGKGVRIVAERPIESPYDKNYDTYVDSNPLDWPQRFGMTGWGLWIARDGANVVGAMAVAWDSPEFELLEGRQDIAELWDLRVREGSQRRGVGSSLFREAARWAKAKGCTVLKVATQDVNVNACRFYAKMGCVLGGIDRLAYKDHPDLAGEVELVWALNLST